MLRIFIQDEEKINKGIAAAHAANADDEPHDMDSEPEEDTTDANPEDLNEEEKTTTLTATPPSAVYHKTTKQQKTSQSLRLNTWCAQSTRRTTR